MFEWFKNKGRKFEDVVNETYKIIAEDERLNAEVFKRESLLGEDDAFHEFDIIYQYEHLGIQYKVAVECKNWNKPINKSQLSDFAYKLRSVGNLNGIFLSTSNLQKGATLVAKHADISFIKYDNFRKMSLTGNEKYLVPSFSTIGDPFWMFMNLDDTDTIQQDAFNDGNIYLFESRYYAEKVKKSQLFMKESNTKLIGITQKHLKDIIRMQEKNIFQVLLYSPELTTSESQPNFTRLQKEHLDWFIHE